MYIYLMFDGFFKPDQYHFLSRASAVILPYNFKTKEDVCVSKSLR